MLNNIPLRRLGTPEEIAALAALPAGSDYITGATLVVDGGLLRSHEEQ